MDDQTMMLTLVMAFFMLGCRFSCSGMKEDFANADSCKKCIQDGGTCSTCQGNGQCTMQTPPCVKTRQRIRSGMFGMDPRLRAALRARGYGRWR